MTKINNDPTGARPPSTGPNPQVSVVIPTFDRERLLAEALESLAHATWRPLEIVVADDGSRDGTEHMVEKFAARHPDLSVRFLARPHEGAIAARNAGVAASTGDYIYFLDSDDLTVPKGIAAMVEALADSGAPFCVAQLAETDLSGKNRFAEGHSDSIIDHHGVIGSQWPTIVGLYPKALLDRLGAYDAHLGGYGEDKEFIWRIVAGCERPGLVIDSVVALRRNHALGQLTDGYSAPVMGRHTISGIAAFVRWAVREGRMRTAIANAAYRRLWIATLRVGAAGDRGWVGRAVALARQLDAYAPSARNRALALIFARMPTAGFAAGFAAATFARRMLHAYRNARRRLGR